MWLLVRILLAMMVGLPLLVVLLFIAAVDDTALVADADNRLNHQNVARIKTLIKQNYPKQFARRHFKIVNIQQDDINLMLNYGLQRYLPGKAKLSLIQNRADLLISIRLPPVIPGQWLNIRTVLTSGDEFTLEVDALSLGGISVPAWIIRPLLNFGHGWGQNQYPEYKELIETVKTLRFEQEKLLLVYEWRPTLLKKIQAKGEEFLIPKAQRDRLIAYHNVMSTHTRRLHGHKMELSTLLRPMFEYAIQRSKESGDAVAENRALLLALSVYANGSNMRHILSHQQGQRILYAGYPRIMLQHRRDLMQHYLVSSGLTVSAGLGIADALGLAKEISDSMGGSGFSFADLLADRAGVKFALLATHDEDTAREIQAYMARKELHENDFMPAVTRLPEGLSEEQFKKRYKQVGSEEYNKIKLVIESRIDACDLFQRYAKT